jgi:hypothetical protein
MRTKLRLFGTAYSRITYEIQINFLLMCEDN